MPLRLSENRYLNYFHYKCGRGAKYSCPPIMLLHGFASSADDFRSVCTLLSAFADVYAFDLPGFGNSRHPFIDQYYTIQYITGVLHEVFTQITDERVIICGYSMGGRIALNYQNAYPGKVGAMILESSSPGIRPGPEKIERKLQDEKLAESILSGGIEQFEQNWSRLSIFDTQRNLSDIVKQQVKSQRLACAPAALALSLMNLGQGILPDLWREISGIEIPVLLITGSHDEKYGKLNAEMCRLISGSAHEIIAGAGHNVHLEKPVEFVNLIQKFLNQSGMIHEEV